MFQRTHIRLTIINSLVFIILISILGSTVYVYIQKQLYKDVNQSLRGSMNNWINFIQHGQTNQGPPGFIFRRGRDDPRNFRIIWDPQGHIIVPQNPDSLLLNGAEKKIKPNVLNKFTDINVGNISVRYIAFQVDIPSNGKFTFQVFRIINSEKEFLHRLLIILWVGCGLGLICSIIAGYFLAGRSLIPIKKAWVKQQQFVSDASHELRTPLAVIQAKTDLLFRSPTATVQDKIVDISTISNESRRLSKLVTNLLTLARSDSDQIEMTKQTFRLDLLLGEIVQHYEEIVTYQEKALQLDASESVFFTADKERIHQLIVILLDNALKYTNEGGEIILSCRQTHSSIFLQIKDSGIGIAEEEIPKIFDRFFQSDKARTESEGAGLGLSIGKWIIEKHHGKVKVTSKLGKGTQIEIVFPKIQKI